MRVAVAEQSGVVVFAPRASVMGEEESVELHEKVRENVKAQKHQMVVDLSGVEWMNSRGLGFLIAALSTATSAGGHLRLAQISPKVRQLLGIVGLVASFEMYPTVEEAVGSFSRPPSTEKRKKER
ncbi:MAG: STAS domain-containing protein [candidate division Zixibacteria bacterium]|nr:STAS domain-containing protein [candidate division Zixibacteria bacterium]MCI0595304.1 STAS domain-containing protein [candidate division Zixibacteria bacterium]